MKRFPPAPAIVWPHISGSDGLGGRWYVKGPSGVGGANLWAVLSQGVEQRKIKILFNTAGTRLMRNAGGEITGITADSPNGKSQIKARRGVILTCGGFEYNAEMQRTYLGLSLYALGTPANTGDGIRMAQDVGADLWHMSSMSCNIGHKVPEYDVPFPHAMAVSGYIYVDQIGNRFIDEAGTDSHAMSFSFCHLDHKSLTYPRIPSYAIFDEDSRQSGPIIRQSGWANSFYQWSKDNSAEVKRGWIKVAATVRDLAIQIGISPDTLQQTVSKYNLCCNGGYDPEFGRRQETLGSIVKPPFHAIAVTPALLNTQGGPRRNIRAQIVDAFGNPIKRLYSAGELGSIWGIVYPGAGNISECLAYGRIAGRNAAAEQPVSD